MRKVVLTEKAPIPRGPYSQGIVASGPVVYVAGQCPISLETQQFDLGTIEHETRLTLNNVKAVLEAAGTDLAHVVKTNVYLKDLADFPAMNEVYKSFFPEEPPARSTVQADLLGGMKVEIDAIAVLPEGEG